MKSSTRRLLLIISITALVLTVSVCFRNSPPPAEAQSLGLESVAGHVFAALRHVASLL